MIAFLVLLSWIVVGVLCGRYWFPNKNPVTWSRLGSLIVCAMLGWFLGFIVVFNALIEAKFWDKPIIPEKWRR